MPKQRQTAEKPIPQVSANPDSLIAAVLRIVPDKPKKPKRGKKS